MTDAEATAIAAEVPLDLAPLTVGPRPNGKSNGNGHAGPSSPIIQAPARERDRESFRYGNERDGDAPLSAAARLTNAYMGFIQNACGRSPDQMTNGDFQRLTQIMKIMDEASAEGKRGRLS